DAPAGRDAGRGVSGEAHRLGRATAGGLRLHGDKAALRRGGIPARAGRRGALAPAGPSLAAAGETRREPEDSWSRAPPEVRRARVSTSFLASAERRPCVDR